MIDTIRLAVDTKTIPHGFRFLKSKSDIFSGTIYPPKELRNSGKYFPKITFCKRPRPQGFSQQILIEFSIPKLLYGNNFSEVCDTDFEAVIDTLRARMREMGIKWRRSSSIKKYSVVRVDYSKNIVFTDGTTVSQILRLFQAADISRTMDVAAGDFRNGGQILHLHTNGRDIALYDKVADLRQSKRSEKRAYEPDNKCQHKLLFSLQSKPKLAVLRYEIRLNSVREIRANLTKIGQDTSDLSFQRLFSADISKSILLYWWDKMLSALPKAPLDSMDTIENLFSAYSKMNTLLRNAYSLPSATIYSPLASITTPASPEKFLTAVLRPARRCAATNSCLLLKPLRISAI